MPLMKNSEIERIAQTIRPRITPFLEAEGSISNADVAKLAKEMTGHSIVSDRTFRMIQEFLTEC